MSAILLSEAAAIPAPSITATPQASERTATARTSALADFMFSSQLDASSSHAVRGQRIDRQDARTNVYRVQYACWINAPKRRLREGRREPEFRAPSPTAAACVRSSGHRSA